MKTKGKKVKYVEWLNAEVMHKASRQWLSELEFIKDEQLFLDNLIKNYTLQLIDSKYFELSKRIIKDLSSLQKENEVLIKIVKIHENNLDVITDGINELEKEESYKKSHRDLISRFNTYISQYRKMKFELFELITGILKTEKQKRLLSK